MHILGIDTEAIVKDIQSGFDPKIDSIIEIGAVIWDWERKQPVKFLSELIDEEDRPTVTEATEEITHICEEHLVKWGAKGKDIVNIYEQLARMMEQCDYLMAHNGMGFDKDAVTSAFKKHGVTMPDKVWIDSLFDIEYPKNFKSLAMWALEYQHGFINPFPHRAVTDVLSMLKVASNYNITRAIDVAKTPMVTVVAQFDYPDKRAGGDYNVAMAEFNAKKDRVKKAKFFWNEVTKIWYKKIRKLFLIEGKTNVDGVPLAIQLPDGKYEPVIEQQTDDGGF